MMKGERRDGHGVNNYERQRNKGGRIHTTITNTDSTQELVIYYCSDTTITDNESI
ncbi:hypothetical protein DPMN_024976 [Dreissena polymorpha]|uniref:Uncharacterized protein n=1 Tax=Dreissena polymorpha TaxID=45954 RepID=A0A9D4RD63_DREPO|nr:hypothetical protein DPMN_024976 [Dreissena polymorpha]